MPSAPWQIPVSVLDSEAGKVRLNRSKNDARETVRVTKTPGPYGCQVDSVLFRVGAAGSTRSAVLPTVAVAPRDPFRKKSGDGGEHRCTAPMWA